MRTIGIQIDKSKAIFVVLEIDGYGIVRNVKHDFTYYVLDHDTDNESVRDFQSKVHAFFDDVQPERIVILARQAKGRFRASPVSFKLEGLMQCYEEIEVEFVSGHALTAFYKKNEFNIPLEYQYQEMAAKVANYLIVKNEGEG